jgi:bifunctional polynucleotide phosphatase/kinase
MSKKADGQEMLILVGSPGSGKSTFFREYLCESHWRLNNDTLKNPNKLAKLCNEYLAAGKSVVVDNLNASCKAR